MAKKYNQRFKPWDADTCTGDSIQKRGSTVVMDCVRFSNCMERLKHSKPTGANADDMVRLATAMYNDVKVTNVADDYSKAFK